MTPSTSRCMIIWTNFYRLIPTLSSSYVVISVVTMLEASSASVSLAFHSGQLARSSSSHQSSGLVIIIGIGIIGIGIGIGIGHNRHRRDADTNGRALTASPCCPLALELVPPRVILGTADCGIDEGETNITPPAPTPSRSDLSGPCPILLAFKSNLQFPHHDCALWALRGACGEVASVSPNPRNQHACIDAPLMDRRSAAKHHFMDPTFWGMAPFLGTGHGGQVILLAAQGKGGTYAKQVDHP
uniref:uncharacterized protein n=1 Tax=Myxine glutinosa TaxID=7769 RepID=UPI00358DF151